MSWSFSVNGLQYLYLLPLPLQTHLWWGVSFSHKTQRSAKAPIGIKSRLQFETVNTHADHGYSTQRSAAIPLYRTRYDRLSLIESRAVTEKPYNAVQCRCKIRYVSKFKAASHGSPCHSTAYLFILPFFFLILKYVAVAVVSSRKCLPGVGRR